MNPIQLTPRELSIVHINHVYLRAEHVYRLQTISYLFVFLVMKGGQRIPLTYVVNAGVDFTC